MAWLNTSKYLQKNIYEAEGSFADFCGKTIGKESDWETGGLYEKYKDRPLAETIQNTLKLHANVGKDIAKMDEHINFAVLVE